MIYNQHKLLYVDLKRSQVSWRCFDNFPGYRISYNFIYNIIIVIYWCELSAV